MTTTLAYRRCARPTTPQVTLPASRSEPELAVAFAGSARTAWWGLHAASPARTCRCPQQLCSIPGCLPLPPAGLFSKPLVPESPADLEAPVGYTPARPLWETLLSATTPASAPAPSAPAAAAAGPTSAAATRASTLPAVVLAVVAALLQLLA